MDFEKVAELIRQDRDLWKRSRELADDATITARLAERGKASAEDAKALREAEQKATHEWYLAQLRAREAFDEFLAPYGLTRRDFYGMAS